MSEDREAEAARYIIRLWEHGPHSPCRDGRELAKMLMDSISRGYENPIIEMPREPQPVAHGNEREGHERQSAD